MCAMSIDVYSVEPRLRCKHRKGTLVLVTFAHTSPSLPAAPIPLLARASPPQPLVAEESGREGADEMAAPLSLLSSRAATATGPSSTPSALAPVISRRPSPSRLSMPRSAWRTTRPTPLTPPLTEQAAAEYATAPAGPLSHHRHRRPVRRCSSVLGKTFASTCWQALCERFTWMGPSCGQPSKIA